MREPVLDAVNDNRNVEGGMQDRPDSFTVSRPALPCDSDVDSLAVELNLICVGELPGGKYSLNGLSEFVDRS
ncbi:hypothetical protein D3C73_1405190 [compost metagenome]